MERGISSDPFFVSKAEFARLGPEGRMHGTVVIVGAETNDPTGKKPGATGEATGTTVFEAVHGAVNKAVTGLFPQMEDRVAPLGHYVSRSEDGSVRVDVSLQAGAEVIVATGVAQDQPTAVLQASVNGYQQAARFIK